MLVDTTETAIKEPPAPVANKTDQPEAPSPPSTPKTAGAPLSKPGSPGAGAPDKRDRSKGEAGDDYPGVRFHVPGTTWRVASCAKGYCWLLQRRRAKDHWESRKFFSNKRRLAVVLTELVGEEAFRAVKDKVDALSV